jgi:hypothetical protein
MVDFDTVVHILRAAPQNIVGIMENRHSGMLLAGIQKNFLDTG